MVFSVGPGNRRDLAAKPREEERRPVEKHVQVAVGRGIDSRDAGHRLDGASELLRDGARRLLQHARQLEGDRDGEIAQRAVGRHLDGKRRHLVDAELAADGVGDRVVKLSLQAQHHMVSRAECRAVSVSS